MKRLLLSLLIVLTATPSALRAANPVSTLLVLTKDNAVHQFYLVDKPLVNFEGTNLVITSDKAMATFAISDVIRFTYQQTDPTGINELRAEDEPTVNYSQDGTLTVSQLLAGTSVMVYTLDGRLVEQLQAHRSGTYRLSLSSLPFGVYLVKAGTTTYKITKR